MTPAVESLRGPQHVLCGGWGVTGFLLIIRLWKETVWWEERAETPRPSCRPPGKGLGRCLKHGGCTRDVRASLLKAGSHPPRALLPAAWVLGQLLSAIVLASPATVTLRRLLTVRRLVISWRRTRMGFHHEQGQFQGSHPERSPLQLSLAGQGRGWDPDGTLPGCPAAPRLLGTWASVPFLVPSSQTSPPAPAGLLQHGAVPPLTCPRPQARGDTGSLCYAPDRGSPGLQLRAAIIWSVTQGSLPFLSGVGAEGLGSSG